MSCAEYLEAARIQANSAPWKLPEQETLLATIAKTIAARDHLQLVRDQLQVHVTELDEVLEAGGVLAGHGFHAQDYGKVRCCVAAANFRSAMRELSVARVKFCEAVVAHNALLKRRVA